MVSLASDRLPTNTTSTLGSTFATSSRQCPRVNGCPPAACALSCAKVIEARAGRSWPTAPPFQPTTSGPEPVDCTVPVKVLDAQLKPACGTRTCPDRAIPVICLSTRATSWLRSVVSTSASLTTRPTRTSATARHSSRSRSEKEEKRTRRSRR